MIFDLIGVFGLGLGIGIGFVALVVFICWVIRG